MALQRAQGSRGKRARSALAQLRHARGLSAAELAAALEVAPSTVARWESGETQPSPRHRRTLADRLGISTEELDDMVQRETGSDGLQNVAQLRPLSGQVQSPWPSALREQFLASIIAGLAAGHACNATWCKAATATARTLGVNWSADAMDAD